MNRSIFLGKGREPLFLLTKMANRHGLIAGATGTGKTVTLRVAAEGLSRAGVPVFMADVKGDLAGMSQIGTSTPMIEERARKLGIEAMQYEKFPVVFWDVFGELGHPVRTTISEIGPMLLGRLLNLNDVQAGVLNIVFKVADERGMLLLDLKDLHAMLQHVGENAKEFTLEYGNVSAASIGAIQRGILALREQGGDNFFGEPALNIDDLIQTDEKGRGVINILAADKLLLAPTVYSTFLLWLLSELFEALPEVGDLEKPKMVFFFDEAHLLFDEAEKPLIDKIEQIVRLIRSRGVGVYFVTQNPLDISEKVLAQLGNRVQHALRAFTARDQKAVRAAAQTFRADGDVNVEEAITELAIGEALVSLLDEQGTPSHVERTLIAPPCSRLGVVSAAERKVTIESSTIYGVYENATDRESAYELLKIRALSKQPEVPAAPPKETAAPASSAVKAPARGRQGPVEAAVVSAARSVGSQIGRQLFRGLLGSIMGGAKKR